MHKKYTYIHAHILYIHTYTKKLKHTYLCIHKYNLYIHTHTVHIYILTYIHLHTYIHIQGSIAIFHEPSFAYVSKTANYEYLDPVFVDMVAISAHTYIHTYIHVYKSCYFIHQMWFKSFSVWLLLKMGFNVLFQDVDLVWFKNPLDLFLHVGVQPGFGMITTKSIYCTTQ